MRMISVWWKMIPSTSIKTIQSFDSQKWIDAMNEEYKSMQNNNVCDLVPLPKGAKLIGCK